jgi:hypothetical protein
VVVDCIPSFVRPSAIQDESQFTVVPYVVHHGKRFPVEVWLDVREADLANVATRMTGIPSRGVAGYTLAVGEAVMLTDPFES